MKHCDSKFNFNKTQQSLMSTERSGNVDTSPNAAAASVSSFHKAMSQTRGASDFRSAAAEMLTTGLQNREFFSEKRRQSRHRPMYAKRGGERSDNFGMIPNLREPGRDHKRSFRKAR